VEGGGDRGRKAMMEGQGTTRQGGSWGRSKYCPYQMCASRRDTILGGQDGRPQFREQRYDKQKSYRHDQRVRGEKVANIGQNVWVDIVQRSRMCMHIISDRVSQVSTTVPHVAVATLTATPTRRSRSCCHGLF
jgi:hypothetical protein